MKKLIVKFKNFVTKSKTVIATAVSVLVVSASTVVTHAAVGVSMLDGEVTTILDQFVLDGKATILALIGVLIPAGLAIWGISFGVKKGISFLQKKLSKAV